MNIDMADSFWQGNTIRLRAPEASDWEIFFAWNQDDEMARTLYFIPFPQSREAVKEYVAKQSLKGPENDNFFFIIENLQGEIVGAIATHNCDRRVGALSYGFSVKKEHRRKGYASDAVLLLLRYYFQELRYQKVTVHVYSLNEASSRLHEKLGFQLEGRIRRTVFTRGRYFDELIYGMTVEEFATRYGQ